MSYWSVIKKKKNRYINKYIEDIYILIADRLMIDSWMDQ